MGYGEEDLDGVMGCIQLTRDLAEVGSDARVSVDELMDMEAEEEMVQHWSERIVFAKEGIEEILKGVREGIDEIIEETR